ncbi:MAG TPA: response regulator, partial [Spirochaetota bacterium]|nr:response regulator [Spirochaetota bacterium]
MDDEKQKTILLVEDEKIIALAESSQLQRFGYNVILASSGNQSVEKFKNNINQIDLILMDINLGDGIDGTEAARQILSIKNIPIVFLTSHSEEEYVNKVKEITRYGYIIKNSTDFVLKSSIEMAFELFETNEKLLKNEQRLTFALSGANDGLWDVIMNTNEVYLSKRGCEILGYTEEELPQIAKVWSELVHPDDLPATQDAL